MGKLLIHMCYLFLFMQVNQITDEIDNEHINTINSSATTAINSSSADHSYTMACVTVN